jgi:hypothetical protein
MKNYKINTALFLAFAFFAFSFAASAQTASLVKRTTYKTETIEFGVGGTVSITGAPRGSISIEGWDKNELEISAEIEIQAPSENDLALLAAVSGFTFDPGFNSLRIQSVGTHDKEYMKKAAKKFPKQLLGMPFKIDYKLKVPRYCDLNIDGGSGDFNLSNVDGEISVKFLDSNARLNLIGGSLIAVFGTGTIDLAIASRSWRGRFADVQLVSGTMNLWLPLSFNAEIDAGVLREGRVENAFSELKPKTRNVAFTDKTIAAKAGNGGVPLKFTVGAGALRIGEYQARP